MNTEGVDRFGAVASGLCAAHCAVTATLPAAFAALGLGALLHPTAEWVFTGIAVAFASGALVAGWRKHRSVPVAALLALGVVALLGSRALEAGSGHAHGDAAGAHDDDGHDSHGHDDDGRDDDGHDTHGHDDDGHDSHGHDDDGHDSHGHGHGGDGHLAGVLLGVVGAGLLITGHLGNLREARRRRDECCD